MKRLILISAIFAGIPCFAQTDCSSDNAFFRFDMNATPKEITRLGTSPEFPFLRNMSSPKQVAAAIKRNDQKQTAGMSELNDLLMAAGFTNGAKDVDESNISVYYVPPGTEGNMGSANYGGQYCKLNGEPMGFKSWKLTSGSGCYMYVLAKCGNAFFPRTATKTACINVPVNVTGDMTLNSSSQKVTTTNDVYIYYERRRYKHAQPHPIPEIADAYPSNPLLLKTTSDVEVVPETYKVTVNSPNNTVTACPDSTLNIAANINVEKTSEYGGYYPTAKKEYKKVSKRVYRKSERKMRKAKRKENRVSRLTGVKVGDEPVASN